MLHYEDILPLSESSNLSDVKLDELRKLTSVDKVMLRNFVKIGFSRLEKAIKQ